MIGDIRDRQKQRANGKLSEDEFDEIDGRSQHEVSSGCVWWIYIHTYILYLSQSEYTYPLVHEYKNNRIYSDAMAKRRAT